MGPALVGLPAEVDLQYSPALAINMSNSTYVYCVMISRCGLRSLAAVGSELVLDLVADRHALARLLIVLGPVLSVLESNLRRWTGSRDCGAVRSSPR